MSGFDGRRGSDAFDKNAIMVDPEVPVVARRKLCGEPLASQSRPGRRHASAGVELIRFRDPSPQVPLPRRPLTAGQWLGISTLVLALVAALSGLSGNLAVSLVFGVFAIATGGLGWVTAHGPRPTLTTGEAADVHLDGWYAAHAEKIFHRRYVQPRADLDTEARLGWGRAVAAANRVYRSEVLRAGLIDSVQVRAAVPEQLWKIAEGLAQISEVRYRHRTILGKSAVQSPAIAGKVAEQERQLGRGRRRVGQRIERLEEFAALLTQADALRQGESVLDRLAEVDGLLRDMLATTEEKAGDLDLAARLELEAQAIIDQATEAISSLAGPYDDDEPDDAKPDPGAGGETTAAPDRVVAPGPPVSPPETTAPPGYPSLLLLPVMRGRAYRAPFAEI